MQVWQLFGIRRWMACVSLFSLLIGDGLVFAEEKTTKNIERVWIITGVMQYEDLRHVSQATVQLRDQEGSVLETQMTNEGGEFI